MASRTSMWCGTTCVLPGSTCALRCVCLRACRPFCCVGSEGGTPGGGLEQSRWLGDDGRTRLDVRVALHGCLLPSAGPARQHRLADAHCHVFLLDECALPARVARLSRDPVGDAGGTRRARAAPALVARSAPSL